MRQINLSPFLRDIVFTTFTSFMTILSVIFITRFLGMGLGPEEFGAYSLARRSVLIIFPFATISMSLAIPKYIALANDKVDRYNYFIGGLILGIIPGFILLLIGLIVKDKLAIIIFHSPQYTSLVTALLIMVIGTSCYSFLYSYYRGSGKMIYANLYQLGMVAIGPAIISYFFAEFGKASLIIWLMSGIFFISLIPICLHTIKAIFVVRHSEIRIKRSLKELFQFGFPRTPGGLALAGIFIIGPFVAPYFNSLKEAGYLIIGQSVLRVLQGGITAFGIVALPKVAQLYADNQNNFIKERITDIAGLILHLGLFFTIHLIIWSDQIVLIWLGDIFKPVIPLMRIYLLALIPYLSFVMFRSVIDAVENKAVNTFNLYISLIITIVLSIILSVVGLGNIGLAIAMTIGFFSTGLLSIVFLHKLFKFNKDALMIKECTLMNIGFFIVSLIMKGYLQTSLGTISSVSIVMLLEGGMFLVYIYLLWKYKAKWTIELEKRIFKDMVR